MRGSSIPFGLGFDAIKRVSVPPSTRSQADPRAKGIPLKRKSLQMTSHLFFRSAFFSSCYDGISVFYAPSGENRSAPIVVPGQTLPVFPGWRATFSFFAFVPSPFLRVPLPSLFIPACLCPPSRPLLLLSRRLDSIRAERTRARIRMQSRLCVLVSERVCVCA